MPMRPERRREYERQYYLQHRDEANEANRRSYQRYRPRKLAKQREYRQRAKLEALTHYSIVEYPICALCGITDMDILCLDHINNDGSKQRAERGDPLGKNLYYYLKKKGFPDGFQVLCFNCNMKKRMMRGKENAYSCAKDKER